MVKIMLETKDYQMIRSASILVIGLMIGWFIGAMQEYSQAQDVYLDNQSLKIFLTEISANAEKFCMGKGYINGYIHWNLGRNELSVSCYRIEDSKSANEFFNYLEVVDFMK